MSEINTIHNNFMYRKDANIKWKPSSYQRLVSALKKNKNTDVPMTPHQMRLPSSVKLYRKEIAIPNVNCSFQRHAIKCDEINSPNGYLTTQTNSINGTVLSKDVKETLYSRQDPKQCAATDACLTIEANARNRVRRSGVTKPNYFMNTNQYLTYRQMTYGQNTYHFKHNNYVQPQGDVQLSLNKPYVAVTTYKPSNVSFEQNGAVSSSTLTARLNYDSKTKTLDNHVLNMEFPRKNTPTFKFGSNDMKCKCNQ